MKRQLKTELSFILFFSVVLLIVLLTFVLFKKTANAPTNETSATRTNVNARSNSNASVIGTVTNFTEVRVSSFLSSTPPQNSILATSPNTVSVVFSEVLGPDSTIVVKDKDQQQVQLGAATFNEDRTTMTTLLRSGVTGPVSVTYRACTLDGSCPQGSFGFTIRPQQK